MHTYLAEAYLYAFAYHKQYEKIEIKWKGTGVEGEEWYGKMHRGGRRRAKKTV